MKSKIITHRIPPPPRVAFVISVIWRFFAPPLKLAFSFFLSLTLLSLFCLAYNYTGCHIQDPLGATDYKWESRQYFSTMKEGFSHFRFDKNGYNNVKEFSGDQKIDILLMGSSHMEAVQIAKRKNTGALLNSLLPTLGTYNIGVSGHNIFVCAKNIKRAVEVFSPQKIVIVETSDVSPSLSQMQKVLEGSLQKIPSNDKGLIYLVQKICPAIKSLYKATDEWISASKISRDEQKNDAVNSAKDLYAECNSNLYNSTLDEFLSFMKKGAGNCRLLIFYHPTARLSASGEYLDNIEKKSVETFSKSCAKNDITFIDMTEDFSRLYFSKRKFAHGFFNTKISSGHLNEAGHKEIAHRLTKTIGEILK